MGLFGPRPKKGVSDYEWEKHGRNRVAGVFGHSSTEHRKAEEVERLLESHLDADQGDRRGHAVMQESEVADALSSLEKAKRISHEEGERVKRALERDMRD